MVSKWGGQSQDKTQSFETTKNGSGSIAIAGVATKDALETLHDSAVMTAVFGQPEEVEHLGSTLKPDATTPLMDGNAD